jgi:hypothetical protein
LDFAPISPIRLHPSFASSISAFLLSGFCFGLAAYVKELRLA